LESVFAAEWDADSIVKLSEIASDITDGDHLPPPKSATGVPFIAIGNIVKGTRRIDFSDTFRVPRVYFEGLKPNRKPRKGDVLYTVTGSFGIPVLVQNDAEFCFQRHIGLVRPKPETDSRWLYYLLLSPQIFRQADESATGAAQRTVSLQSLRNFRVPKVSTTRQRETAKNLDSLLTQVGQLETNYPRKFIALEELKKSLLHEAFNGRL
jgi:type I restriction enzyme, S subunit